MKSWLSITPLLLAAGGAKLLDSGRNAIGCVAMICAIAVCCLLNASEERDDARSREEQIEDFISSVVTRQPKLL